MKRIKLLSQSQENKEEAQLSYQVAQDKLQLESDILATEQAVSVAKQELLALKQAPVLSPANIITKMDEVKGLVAGLSTLKDLRAELF